MSSLHGEIIEREIAGGKDVSKVSHITVYTLVDYLQFQKHVLFGMSYSQALPSIWILLAK